MNKVINILPPQNTKMFSSSWAIVWFPGTYLPPYILKSQSKCFKLRQTFPDMLSACETLHITHNNSSYTALRNVTHFQATESFFDPDILLGVFSTSLHLVYVRRTRECNQVSLSLPNFVPFTIIKMKCRKVCHWSLLWLFSHKCNKPRALT